MHMLKILIISLALSVFPADAKARSSRQTSTIQTAQGEVLVEDVGGCRTSRRCPAVLILSGSKGFGAPAYDAIGDTLRAAGLNGYLIHVVTAADIEAISSAGSARARKAYYARRLPDWISIVGALVSYFRSQTRHGGSVGIIGISLGAQIASAASVGRTDVDALVLVDGGFPSGYSAPVRFLPPLHLIWGSADQTFPLSVGQKLERTAQRLGGPVSLEVYEGEAHDFFLRPRTRKGGAAHESAANFLASRLSR